MENNMIIYNNGEIELDVSVDKETVWASTNDIASLFVIDRSVVSKHIKNIFKDKELDIDVVCANFAHTTKHGALNNKTQTKLVKYYNLDIILSVGYRTNSVYAIKFRQWATKILKQYIINGYAINSEKITHDRFKELENDVTFLKQNIINLNKLVIDKNITPTQGIFYDGQIFDAYIFINDLLKSAKDEVVLVDNYIDESILTLFSKYPDIKFTIISSDKNKRLKLDIKRYNSQYNNLTLKHSSKFHDRFLIIDKTTYHLGASLKDLGKKVFAFSKMAQELKV
jgi:hypothetical protein